MTEYDEIPCAHGLLAVTATNRFGYYAPRGEYWIFRLSISFKRKNFQNQLNQGENIKYQFDQRFNRKGESRFSFLSNLLNIL